MSREQQEDEVIALARALIERPSVTPEDGGCQALIAEHLEPLGFTIEPMPFGEVKNLWARRGEDGPLFAFAGHTDVVPPGPLEGWRHPPFSPVLEDGRLYGRGAADMKGSLAAMVVAVKRFLGRYPEHRGSIAFLLTSDEEGPTNENGTVKVVERLTARMQHIDFCLVGEPTARERTGDVIKNGRRGSLSGELTVHGVQGHVAYPELAKNPIHAFAPALAELVALRFDEGNAFFPPTSLQFSNLHAGTGASNVIPGELSALFNFRYSTEVTAEALMAITESVLDRHGLDYTLRWHHGGPPFLTPAGELVEAVISVIRAITGETPELSTSGGTSDGRFIAPTGAQVVELGPPNATIHKVDECVAVEDLERLALLYEGILERLLA